MLTVLCDFLYAKKLQIKLTFCKGVRFSGGGGTPKSVNFICTFKVYYIPVYKIKIAVNILIGFKI